MGVLVVLESVLSIDNALVLGLLAGRLSRAKRMRALSYGLVGAFVLRLVMIGTAVYLLRWAILKVFGGVYLLWVGARYFLPRRGGRKKAIGDAEGHGFLGTVVAIELTDVAFAVDSVLAAVALVGPAPRGTPGGNCIRNFG